MVPQNKYVGAASVLLVLAVFGFIWRARTSFSIPVPEPFEVLVFLIGCVLAVGFLRSSLPRVKEFTSEMKRYRLVLAVILAAPLLGLLGSSLAGLGWLEYTGEAAKEYARLLVGVFIFLAAAYIAFLRPQIVKPIFAAIAASPLPLWFALILPLQPFFLQAYRLRGLGNDPNYLSAWIATGVVASTILFLWERSRVRWLWFGAAILAAPLLLWAMSRAVWFAAAFALLVAGILFIREELSWDKARLLGTVFFGLMISLAVGYLLLPVPSQSIIATRLISPFLDDEHLSRVIVLATRGGGIAQSDVFAAGIDKKVELWSEGGRRFLKSPLGFGPAYYFWYPAGVVGVGEMDKHKLSVHELYLETGLVGGWLGFGAWLYFIFFLGRGATRLARTLEPQFLALAISFFMLLLSGFFFDMFTLLWLWLIMGLVAAYSILDSRGELYPVTYEKQEEA